MWCKAEFSASLLQSSVSHDPSEIILICWFAAQKTVLTIINLEISCAVSYPLVCRYVNSWQYLYPFYCSWRKNCKSDHLEKYCHFYNKANSQIMAACVNNDTVGFVEGEFFLKKKR